MPLIRNDDLVRIDLPVEGEWVEVKRRLSRGDEIAVQRALTSGSTITAGTSALMDLSGPEVIEAAEFAGLDVAIKAWSFAEPVTPANIRALDPPSVDAIKARLNELYEAPRGEEERRNLDGRSARRSKAAELSPKS